MKFKFTALVFVICSVTFNGCAQIDCDNIPGLESILIPGNIVLLGEIHGTKEAPYYIGQMACNGLKNEIKVTVGLELPKSEQYQVDEFLNSQGTPNDRQNFLNLPFWAKDYQDGRTSLAMFDLIESLRKMKIARKLVDVLFIDNPGSGNREIEMSDNVIRAVKNNPNNLFLILTGNLHSIIADGSGKMGSYIVEKLGTEKVISLKQNYPGGSAWVCLMGEGCGPVKLRGTGGSEIGIFLDETLVDYDGFFAMDSIHASLPAKELMIEK